MIRTSLNRKAAKCVSFVHTRNTGRGPRHIGKLLLSLCLMAALIFAGIAGPSNTACAADVQMPENSFLKIVTEGQESIYELRILNLNYDSCTFINLRDVAKALNGTSYQFNLSVYNSEITITTGASYAAGGQENQPFPDSAFAEDAEKLRYTFKRNAFVKDGAPLFYYTMLAKNESGYMDVYMNPMDFGMLMNWTVFSDGQDICIAPDRVPHYDLQKLENEGFFTVVDSCLVADITTGSILFSHNPSLGVAIASTTKLMTYLCVMDALAAGEISENQTVTISGDAADLSHTADGVIWLKAGQETNIPELLRGMLLSSSNECALTLAETVAGSEEAFVARMNAKAEQIGLSEETVFYNPHGLPLYGLAVTTAKLQNRMSALDMLQLITYIFEHYPQITEITSLKTAFLPTLSFQADNTNPELYNIPEVVGLKTGTTNRAGACLACAMELQLSDGVHTIVSLEFGAENSMTRGLVSEVLLRGAKDMVKTEENTAGNTAEDAPGNSSGAEIPTSAEALLACLLAAR